MSGDGGKPDAVAGALAAAEAMGKQKKANAKALKGRRKAKAGAVKKRAAQTKARRVAWLRAARVIDLPAMTRLLATGVGAKRLSRALGTTVATAQKLMAGTHWQQSPDKVAEFNRFHGASLAPDGTPTAKDLEKHGGKYKLAISQDSEGDKDLRRMIEDAGVAPAHLDEAMRRLKLLGGALTVGDLPGKPDTKYFQEQFDEKLKLALACLDPVTVASMTGEGLTRMVSMLVEKRALLRGEPTAIIRNEQRGGLDKVAALFLAEAARRGIALDLPKTEYREVTE